jgi:hypothetical protein
MMLSLVAFLVVLAVASVLWDGHRSGRFRFRLVQFRVAAPLAGPASSARVTPRH